MLSNIWESLVSGSLLLYNQGPLPIAICAAATFLAALVICLLCRPKGRHAKGGRIARFLNFDHFIMVPVCKFLYVFAAVGLLIFGVVVTVVGFVEYVGSLRQGFDGVVDVLAFWGLAILALVVGQIATRILFELVILPFRIAEDVSSISELCRDGAMPIYPVRQEAGRGFVPVQGDAPAPRHSQRTPRPDVQARERGRKAAQNPQDQKTPRTAVAAGAVYGEDHVREGAVSEASRRHESAAETPVPQQAAQAQPVYREAEPSVAVEDVRQQAAWQYGEPADATVGEPRQTERVRAVAANPESAVPQAQVLQAVPRQAPRGMRSAEEYRSDGRQPGQAEISPRYERASQAESIRPSMRNVEVRADATSGATQPDPAEPYGTVDEMGKLISELEPDLGLDDFAEDMAPRGWDCPCGRKGNMDTHCAACGRPRYY